MNLTKIEEIKQRFGIIGNSESLLRAIERAALVAPTECSILVVGESGTGKEHFPKIIHYFSPRKHNKLFAINCGAIPAGTIDSELFGHVKGAFTGATADHKGYFEEADGGTIFLDEVGELPLETQVRLLRVLETGEFIRVGAAEPKKTNVRVVAATNMNMQAAIDAGRFREDLYYRLNTVQITLPPLRERKEDIPMLFRKFAADYAEKYNMPSPRLTEEAEAMLKNYYFRGNIRQLRNIAEQVCVIERTRVISAEILHNYLPQEERESGIALSRHSSKPDGLFASEHEMLLYKAMVEMKKEIEVLKAEVENLKTQGGAASLPRHKENEASPQIIVSKTDNDEMFTIVEEVKDEDLSAARMPHLPEDKPLSMKDIERDMIRQALENNKGNKRKTAKELNMPERTLYRKIQEYQL